MAPALVTAKAHLAAMALTSRPTRSFLGTPVRCSISSNRRVAASARLSVMAADTEQVLKEVRSIIAEQLGSKLDEVTPESKFVDLGADSLDTVEIMMALEEKFDLELDEEGAEKISTVQEAANLIADQIKS